MSRKTPSPARSRLRQRPASTFGSRSRQAARSSWCRTSPSLLSLRRKGLFLLIRLSWEVCHAETPPAPPAPRRNPPRCRRLVRAQGARAAHPAQGGVRLGGLLGGVPRRTGGHAQAFEGTNGAY